MPLRGACFVHWGDCWLSNHSRVTADVEVDVLHDDVQVCITKEKYLLVMLSLLLIAQIRRVLPPMTIDMCMGTHDTMEMISLCHHYAALVE